VKSTVIRHNIKTVASVAVFFCVLALVQGGDAMASPEFGASAQAEYDSNILPEADTTTQNSGDWALAKSAFVGWESSKGAGPDWQARYDYSATSWQQAVEFDTDIHSAYLRASYNRAAHTTDLVGLIARADLEGKTFMHIRRLSPAWGYFFTDRLYVRGQLDIGDKRFQLYPERDATQLGGRATVYWMFNRTLNYLSLRTVFRHEDTRSEPFGYDAINTRLRWKLRSGKVKYYLQGSLERRRYEAVWSEIGERRQDDRLRISAGLKWAIGRGFTFEGDIGGDEYHSNLPVADYRQFRLNSELSWKF